MQPSPFSGRDVPKDLTRMKMLGAVKALQVETSVLYDQLQALEKSYTSADNSAQFLAISGTRGRGIDEAFSVMIAANESIHAIIESILGPVKETAAKV